MTDSHRLLHSAAVLQLSRRKMQPTIDFFVDQLDFSIGMTVEDAPQLTTLNHDEQIIMLNCTWMLANTKQQN